ncbi:MAG: orotidine-5'-phosphate decarboxylase [Actinomycetota bacterium]
MNFGVRLAASMGERGPLCVGIDPHPALLAAWHLPDSAAGIREFSLRVVDELSGTVAALKPQSAFFERHGAAGVAVLEEVLGECRRAGVTSILDVKRGDIGSTMTAYAEAHLRPGAPLEADAITLSPYLGAGSLAPAVDLALANGKGVFVLALTSNPEGAAVQHAAVGGTSVAGAVVAHAAAVNARFGGVGPVGLVVGATVGDAVARLGLDLAASGAIILAPGVGAQGGSAVTLREVFGAALDRVLASVSRSVLAAGPGALLAAAGTEISGLVNPR